MSKSKGFTLIELMITLVIVAILASIAIPMFAQQLRKSRRTDGMQALSDLQLKEERWRSNNTAYASIATIGGSTLSPNKYYTLSYSTPSTTTGTCTCTAATCYQLTATATSLGNQSADTACASLVITNLCGSVSKTPTSDRCWN